MTKMLIACSLAIGCGGKVTEPTTAKPAEPTTATSAAADDFCDVVGKVMDAAKDKFTTVAQLAPAGAKATVAAGPINVSWTASWPSKDPYEVALAAIKAKLLACPFGSRLTGGEAHVTEKGGKANAIDWKDAQTRTGLEVIAEGAGSIDFTVVAE